MTSRRQTLQPDVILSTVVGGGVERSTRRGLPLSSTSGLPPAQSSLERLGSTMGKGHIIGACGDHHFFHSKRVGDRSFDNFVADVCERTGSVPIHSVFHISRTPVSLRAVAKDVERHRGLTQLGPHDRRPRCADPLG